MKEIEAFLREHKPAVQDDATFLLEAQRRMEAVEGIKAEMDRQRSRGRRTLIITLVIGLVLGALLTALAFLYPADAASDGLWFSIHRFLRTWWKYIIYPLAGLALGLALLVADAAKNTVRL